ncbi:MAG: hypothetical protein H0V87_03440 [Chloroflexi bacterium]|nr:hypothetical protein [Chloroflexota bacterium]
MRLATMRLAAALACALLVGCRAASPPTPTPEPPVQPAEWQEHDVPAARVALSLPPDWLALDEADLFDPDTRAELERDYAGARGLFSAIGSQGSRVRLVFLGVDPAARGTGALASTVAIVAVEPRIPPIGLGLGADFVLDALDAALSVETAIERRRAELEVGRAIVFGFDHRILDEGDGPGIRARLDGALVTTDASSFLVLRNVDASGPASPAPSLDEVLGSLRVLP